MHDLDTTTVQFDPEPSPSKIESKNAPQEAPVPEERTWRRLTDPLELAARLEQNRAPGATKLRHTLHAAP